MSYSFNTTPNFVSHRFPFPISPSSVVYTPHAPYTPVAPIGATVIIPGPVTLPQFLDLNKDTRVINQVTKYFRYKTLDKWLYSDMTNLLGYFTVTASGVQFIKTISEYKNTPISQMNSDEVDKIIKWIEHYLLTEDTMKRILSHFVNKTKSNWYELHKNEYFIKEIIEKKLLTIIKETIKL
jgi:hypothetical protein